MNTTSNTMELLKALAEKQRGKHTIKPSPPKPQAKESVTAFTTIKSIDIDTSRNRIDLYFDGVPTQAQRNDLKDRGFRYNPDRVCWYHKYDNDNVKWINQYFGESIDYIPNSNCAVIEYKNKPDIIIDSIPEPTPIESTESDPADAFSIYKRQVKDLCEALHVDPADLALIAVSKLHDQTFQ